MFFFFSKYFLVRWFRWNLIRLAECNFLVLYKLLLSNNFLYLEIENKCLVNIRGAAVSTFIVKRSLRRLLYTFCVKTLLNFLSALPPRPDLIVGLTVVTKLRFIRHVRLRLKIRDVFLLKVLRCLLVFVILGCNQNLWGFCNFWILTKKLFLINFCRLLKGLTFTL